MRVHFRAGDVLRLSCPPEETHVSSAREFYFAVPSPWNEVDPESEFRWNGELAFRRDLEHPEWLLQPYRTDPEPDELWTGSTCVIGIPPTVVQVLGVYTYDPPRDIGWLPRPRTLLELLMHGHTEDPDWEDQGFTLDPDDPAVDIDLIFRPYAFLETGDEIADQHGHAWQFHSPWHWKPFAPGPETPSWPLTLLTRAGAPDPAAATQVAHSTSVGSHETERNRWKELTGTDPLMKPTSQHDDE